MESVATRPTTIKIWWLAIRPKTLSLSWVPVLLGNVLAWRDQGYIAWPAAIVALLSALLIQIGTNLHNDAKDFEQGIDRADRQGPTRVTAMGWLTANQVRTAAYSAFGITLLLGIYLVWVGGIPILLLGILSLISGLAYTGGPRPIAYSGLGELFVFLFFGLGAVTGSYYLSTGNISWTTLMVGAALGLQAAAVLAVNNYRDMDTDRIAGKTTLAIRLGLRATRIEYAFLLLAPFFLVSPYSFNQPIAFIPWLALPLALQLVVDMFRFLPSPKCNQLLARTAQLQLVFGILLVIGYLATN